MADFDIKEKYCIIPPGTDNLLVTYEVFLKQGNNIIRTHLPLGFDFDSFLIPFMHDGVEISIVNRRLYNFKEDKYI